MPRRSSGPRLWFDKKRGTWTIIDGRSRRRTGFAISETRQAEKFLGEYIASKHVVKDSATPFIADVLAAYATEHLAHKVSGIHILYDIRKLAKWWGEEGSRDNGQDVPGIRDVQERAGMQQEGIGFPWRCDQTLEPGTRPFARCPKCDAPSEAVCTLKFYDEGRSGTLSIDCPEDSASCPVLHSWLVHWKQAQRDSGP